MNIGMFIWRRIFHQNDQSQQTTARSIKRLEMINANLKRAAENHMIARLALLQKRNITALISS